MASLAVDTDTRIVMRDGTALAADILRPAGPGRHPALLYRTPYDRTSFASVSLQVHALKMASAGYAVVLQDVRGRGGSDGEFEPFVGEQRDGVDTIHWIAEQSWCSGKVGMVGISYNAYSQIAAAAAAPEPLAAWLPGMGPFDVRTSWIREGGAFNFAFNVSWLLGLATTDARTADIGPVLRALSNPPRTADRPPRDQPQLEVAPVGAAYFNWLRMTDPYPDDGRVPGPGTLGRIQAPALVLAGWFDVFQPGSFDLYGALEAEAGHLGHRLIAGPWDHTGLPFDRRAGDRDHGFPAMLDYHALQLQWFDTHLRDGDPPGWKRRFFVTGAGEWADSSSESRGGQTRSWDLNPDGTMSTTGHGGEIAIDVEAADPTPALGGRPYPWEPVLRPGSYDQRRREARLDVATFTTDVLDGPLRVEGEVGVETVVVPDGHGTDVVATLSDVDETGASWNIADGVRRVPGAAGEMQSPRISLGHVAHEFAPGHRIRVSLSAAAFPRFDLFGGSGRRVFLAGPGYSRLIMTEVA